MAQVLTALIVDDEQPALDLLANLLNQTKEFSSIRTTTNTYIALELVESIMPDVLFLDIEMPEMNGFDLLKKIHQNGYSPQVVFVTGHANYALKAIKVACLHYLLKPPDIDDIYEIIKRLKEKNLSDNKIKKIGIERLAFFNNHYKKFNALSNREKTILYLLTEGFTNKQIGKKLNISSLTVKTHRQNIIKKLGTTNPGELYRFVEVFMD